MSISILGGKAKGFTLKVITNTGLRPTSVILRRKIFDRYQDLSGVCFIDACAGTGSMGLEACSRGADKVYFIESNKKFFNLLKENVKKFESHYANRFDFQANCTLAKVQNWLAHFKETYKGWDMDQRENTIFFFDPPYNLIDLYKKVIQQEIIEQDWFQGLIWVESDRLKGLPKSFWEDTGCKVHGTYEHSDSYLIVLENSH